MAIRILRRPTKPAMLRRHARSHLEPPCARRPPLPSFLRLRHPLRRPGIALCSFFRRDTRMARRARRIHRRGRRLHGHRLSALEFQARCRSDHGSLYVSPHGSAPALGDRGTARADVCDDPARLRAGSGKQPRVARGSRVRRERLRRAAGCRRRRHGDRRSAARREVSRKRLHVRGPGPRCSGHRIRRHLPAGQLRPRVSRVHDVRRRVVDHARAAALPRTSRGTPPALDPGTSLGACRGASGARVAPDIFRPRTLPDSSDEHSARDRRVPAACIERHSGRGAADSDRGGAWVDRAELGRLGGNLRHRVCHLRGHDRAIRRHLRRTRSAGARHSRKGPRDRVGPDAATSLG